MLSAKIVAGLLLATCLVTGPAAAASLLGGVSGLLGGASSGGGGVSVPGVASASTDSNGGTHVNGSLLGGGGSTVNLGLGSLAGGTSSVGLTLPGSGNSVLDQTVGNVAGTLDGLTGNTGTIGSLLTDTGLGGTLGGNGGGLVGSGGATGAAGTFSVDNGRGGRTVFARYGANCIGPDPRAIGRLLQSRSYSPRTLDSWHRAANVQVVPVKLCPETRGAVRRQLDGNSSVAMIQNLAAADPLIRTSLSRTRYGAGNVLAVDQAAGTLTVYVY